MSPQNPGEVKTVVNEQLRMLELVQQGFHCSEVLLFMGLDAQGKENPDLIRAISALAGGIGFTGDVCGALTGGACLVGLYTGRGTPAEADDPRMRMMIQELVDWFSQKYGSLYGGIRCREITEDEPAHVTSRCPRLVTSVHKKVKSLLDQYEVSLANENSSQNLSQEVRSACPIAAKFGQL